MQLSSGRPHFPPKLRQVMPFWFLVKKSYTSNAYPIGLHDFQTLSYVQKPLRDYEMEIQHGEKRTARQTAIPSSPPPERKQQRWNSSNASILRIVATYWCFILLGANDSSYGVRVPWFLYTVLLAH